MIDKCTFTSTGRDNGTTPVLVHAYFVTKTHYYSIPLASVSTDVFVIQPIKACKLEVTTRILCEVMLSLLVSSRKQRIGVCVYQEVIAQQDLIICLKQSLKPG